MSEDERKKLKETTSYTRSLLTSPAPQRQPLWEEEVESGVGAERERPMKTAMVKRALTLTMESRAVMWTVVLVFNGMDAGAVLVAGFGDGADPDPSCCL